MASADGSVLPVTEPVLELVTEALGVLIGWGRRTVSRLAWCVCRPPDIVSPIALGCGRRQMTNPSPFWVLPTSTIVAW